MRFFIFFFFSHRKVDRYIEDKTSKSTVAVVKLVNPVTGSDSLFSVATETCLPKYKRNWMVALSNSWVKTTGQTHYNSGTFLHSHGIYGQNNDGTTHE